MSKFGTSIFLNHSILIAAVIAAIRFKKMDKSFYPFIAFITLSLLNESLSLLLIYKTGSNAFNSNIYVLIEYFIILFQFYKWKNDGPSTYLLFAVLGLVIWVADNMVIHSLYQNNSIFRIFYSLVILFFAIDATNWVITFSTGSVLKNPIFLISTTFLLFFSCKTFIEIFNVFETRLSIAFYERIWQSFSVINFIANIIYAIAVLCIPKKQEFIFQY